MGLFEAIKQLLEQLKRTGVYEIEFIVEDQYHSLEEQKEFILFRVLQEAINNIIRHAEAKPITIFLNCSKAPALQLSVRDDGKGFDQRGSSNTGPRGSGLNN